MGYKISVITPCLNSGKYLEKAICSVLDQEYSNYEHIIIDGGSTDSTLEILHKYPHLKWISEPDDGQVDAMNKGFENSTGEIIVYLNADDYFLCGAFSTVIPYFESGEKFVVGDVVVQQPEKYVINRPKVKLWQMIRHWEPMAFPNNPVGYFYRREVQESIPFEEEFPCFMDIRFLFEAAVMYKFKKINGLLGVYRCFEDTKTFHNMKESDYWTKENFYFIDKYLKFFPEDYRQQFHTDREKGYQTQRKWQFNAMMKQYEVQQQINSVEAEGSAGDKFKKTKAPVSGATNSVAKVRLPPNRAMNGKLADAHFYQSEGANVFLVYQMGKVGSSSIYKAIRDHFPESPAYHFHYLTERRLLEGVQWHKSNNFPAVPEHLVLGDALRQFMQHNKSKVHWIIISLVRDPVALQVSMIFQNLKEAFSEVVDKDESRVNFDKITDLTSKLLSEFETRESHFLNWFDYEIREPFGINIYDYLFDKDKGYSMIKKGNVDILLFKFESLQKSFSDAMNDFVGVKNIDLPAVNVGSKKQFGDEYAEIKERIKFSKKLCTQVYNSKLVRHFYTDAEIEQFMNRWT